jgi:hypothetical protein
VGEGLLEGGAEGIHLPLVLSVDPVWVTQRPLMERPSPLTSTGLSQHWMFVRTVMLVPPDEMGATTTVKRRTIEPGTCGCAWGLIQQFPVFSQRVRRSPCSETVSATGPAWTSSARASVTRGASGPSGLVKL